MTIESKAMARFVRIAPRKARVIANLVRGQKVAQALDALAFTRKSAAPIVKKLIESALSNARQANAGLDVDALYVTSATVDKGPNRNMRRYRPRAMGRATPIVKGVSHIVVTLSDQAPPLRGRRKVNAERQAAKAAKATTAPTTTTTTTAG